MSNDPWAAQQQPNPNPFGGQQGGPQQQWPQGQQAQQRGPQPPSLGDALAGGGKAAFDQNTPVGVAIQGTIVSAKVAMPRVGDKFWDDGNPKWIVEILIENAQWSQDGSAYQPLRTSPEDDGRRMFFVKTWGENFRALQSAIQNAGFTDAEKALAPGTLFAGKHTGRQKSTRGGNDELLYAYRIGGQAPAPSPAPQQQAAPPAQPPQPQQQTAPPAPAPQQWPQPGGQQEEPPF